MHALDEFEDRFGRFPFLDGNDAVFSDFLERIGHQAADGLVVVRRDRRDLLHLFLLGQATRQRSFEILDRGIHGLFNAALHRHRIGAGGDVSQSFLIDRQRQDGCGGRAIAGDVASFLRDCVDQLGAHVFEWIGQVDFLRYGDAVLGYGRAAE